MRKLAACLGQLLAVGRSDMGITGPLPSMIQLTFMNTKGGS